MSHGERLSFKAPSVEAIVYYCEHQHCENCEALQQSAFSFTLDVTTLRNGVGLIQEIKHVPQRHAATNRILVQLRDCSECNTPQPSYSNATVPTHNTVTERMFNVCRNVCRNASICRSTVEPEGAGAFWCPLEPGGTGAERLKCECELQAQESYVIEKLTSMWSRKVLSGGLLGKPTWFQRSVITRYPDHFGTQKELV